MATKQMCTDKLFIYWKQRLSNNSETYNAYLWNYLILPDQQINFIWEVTGNHLRLNLLLNGCVYVHSELKYVIIATKWVLLAC